ncbi:MAG: MFS transporter [Candidatus Thorarchaeota archaeon]
MGRVTSYFGLSDTKPEVIRLTSIAIALSTMMQATIAISTTFYLIFVAEALGNGDYIVGMTLVAVLVVIEMAIQTTFDYPTGVIGDWIGQRYILCTAFLTYAVAFYVVSLVTGTTPFALLVLVYVLMGFAASQQSGALGSWFDNNWRVAMPEDEGRKQYGVLVGKWGMLRWLTNVLILIPGGILAAIFARAWVFQVQSVLCVVIAIASWRLIRNLPEAEEQRQTRPNLSEYASLLKEGVTYLFSSQYVKYLLIGTMFVNSVISVWGNLILFPMYYTYLVSDVAVASFRTVVMVPLVIYSERSGNWAKRFNPEKWIPRFTFIQTCGAVFFWVFAVIMGVFQPPPEDSPMIDYMFPGTDILLLRVPVASFVPVLLMVIMFFGCGAFLQLAGVLSSRIFVDAIPNRVRNGVYSLFPTVILILAIPQITFFGWLIPLGGIPLTLFLCGCLSTVGVLMIRKGLSYPKPWQEETAIGVQPDQELEEGF